MKFADIPGHADVKRKLMAMVDNGHMPHALLLEGPSGSGKFALARALAQYIHCQNRRTGVDSCGSCPACKQHEAFNHVDTIFSFPFVKSDSGDKQPVSDQWLPEFHELLSEHPFMSYEEWLVKLDNVNAQPVIYVSEAASLAEKLKYTTRASKHKVVLMWLPEKLREDAANKLLKLVEEPYPDTIFIMTSDQSRLILPTIYSRTQRVGVKRYSDEEVADYLATAYPVDATTAAQIARLAEGNMTKAIDLMGLSKERKLFLDFFIELMRKAYSRDVKALKKWAGDLHDLGRERQMKFYDYCAHMVRENFILNLHNSELNALTTDEQNFSARFSPFINERNVLKIFKAINDARADIAANGYAKLVNFDLAVKIIILLRK